MDAPTSYRPRVQAMFEGLRAVDGVRVVQAVIAPPASPEALATAARYAGRLPRGVTEFYAELNGFELRWETADASRQGAIHLLPVERIFGPWRGSLWFDDFPGGDRFRAVKPFDFFQPEACAAFLQETDRPPGDEVLFHVVGEALCPTGLTFPEYLELALTARGFHYWPTTLCEETAANPEARAFQQHAPATFPDLATQRFQPPSGRTKPGSALRRPTPPPTSSGRV